MFHELFSETGFTQIAGAPPLIIEVIEKKKSDQLTRAGVVENFIYYMR